MHTLTDTAIPGWAHIVAAGGTFTWEVWKPSDLIGDSMSHGWGSSALVAMQETLLGVTLEEPAADGTARAAVPPPSAGLGARLGVGADGRRARPGVVAAAGRGHVRGPDRAAQRDGDGAAARRHPSGVREGASRRRGPGVTVVSATDGAVVLSVGSGTYRFTST